MIKLMKYEFRKNMFSKLILLAITAIAEVLFLLGVFSEWEYGLGLGVFGLYMCAIFGIMYIGIESLITFHRDLNTKQSYMLFLTPRNSFQILGAKVVENGLSIFLTGLFFVALAACDFTVSVIRIGGLKEFLDIIRSMAASIHININVPPEELVGTALWMLSSWMLMIVTGYLAIILSATVLAGKRFSGFVSFLLYLLLLWAVSAILNILPEPEGMLAYLGVMIAGTMCMVAVIYGIAGWIMERKLSV